MSFYAGGEVQLPCNHWRQKTAGAHEPPSLAPMHAMKLMNYSTQIT